MAIRLKVAKTPEEIDDALWVRHEVFIVEDGKFGGKPMAGKRMMDIWARLFLEELPCEVDWAHPDTQKALRDFSEDRLNVLRKLQKKRRRKL